MVDLLGQDPALLTKSTSLTESSNVCIVSKVYSGDLGSAANLTRFAVPRRMPCSVKSPVTNSQEVSPSLKRDLVWQERSWHVSISCSSSAGTGVLDSPLVNVSC